MATGLKQDCIVILRIDGEDLLEFINSPSYEAVMASIHSRIESPEASLCDYMVKAFEKLSVDQGMPPSSDSWVMSNIIEPVLLPFVETNVNKPISRETFLVEFKKAADGVAQHLKNQPVIVAHSENTFDGSTIKRFLSNKSEFNESLNTVLESVPKDRDDKIKISTDNYRFVLDAVSPSTGLPHAGAVEQMDKVINDALKSINASESDGMIIKQDEFKKNICDVLGSILLKLEVNPITVSSDSVVVEPLASSSTLDDPEPVTT